MEELVFELNEKLKDRIARILRDSAEKSINQIHKELSRWEDTKSLHRLTLTGYLHALADMGILIEKQIPPAKVYSLSPMQKKDIYTAVSTAIKERGYAENEAIEIYTYILAAMFKRPVLEDELKFGNFSNFKILKSVNLKSTEKSEMLQRLKRVIKQDVDSERAYLPNSTHDEEMKEILTAILLEDYGAKTLRIDKKPKQEKITVEDH